MLTANVASVFCIASPAASSAIASTRTVYTAEAASWLSRHDTSISLESASACILLPGICVSEPSSRFIRYTKPSALTRTALLNTTQKRSSASSATTPDTAAPSHFDSATTSRSITFAPVTITKGPLTPLAGASESASTKHDWSTIMRYSVLGRNASSADAVQLYTVADSLVRRATGTESVERSS